MSILGQINLTKSVIQESTTPIIQVPILDYVQAGEFTESSTDTDPIGHMELPANIIPKNGYLLNYRQKYDF